MLTNIVGKAQASFKNVCIRNLPKETREKESGWHTDLHCVALEKIVKIQYLLRDLKHLTNFNHTGTLEVYLSVYNKYCPKWLDFAYPVIIAKAELAALDFRAGVGLQQTTAKKAELSQKQ